MANKTVRQLTKLIDDIDTYGHAELVKQKMAALQSLLNDLANIVKDKNPQLYQAASLTALCEKLTKILKENQAIFTDDIENVAFDQTTTNENDINILARTIAKKQAILLDSTASNFLDEKNIQTVKSTVEKELAAAQTALDTAQAQNPKPDRAPLEAKRQELAKRLDLIKKIEAEAQEMNKHRVLLQSAIADPNADKNRLRKTMDDYNLSVEKLNKSLPAYNQDAIHDHKIAPPVPPPTRELSTARIAANWTVQVGIGLDGIGHGVCTGKAQISQLVKLAQTMANSAMTLMNAGVGSIDIRRAALLETEIPYSVCNYEQGNDPNKPSTLLVIQHQEHNKVTDCSNNLDPTQKRSAALEMAKMYAINYQRGPVQINGKDPAMAGMLHAALLTLLPGVEIRNYVAGHGNKPSWHERNRSFINRHLSGFEKELESAAATVAYERARAERKAERIAAVCEYHDNRLDESFFSRAEINKQTDKAGFKERVMMEKEQAVSAIELEDSENSRRPTNG